VRIFAQLVSVRMRTIVDLEWVDQEEQRAPIISSAPSTPLLTTLIVQNAWTRRSLLALKFFRVPPTDRA